MPTTQEQPQFNFYERSSPSVVPSSQSTGDFLKLTFKLRNSGMRRDHLLRHYNIPRKFGDTVRLLALDLTTQIAEVLGEPFRCVLVWKHHGKVDASRLRKVVTITPQATERSPILIIRELGRHENNAISLLPDCYLFTGKQEVDRSSIPHSDSFRFADDPELSARKRGCKLRA